MKTQLSVLLPATAGNTIHGMKLPVYVFIVLASSARLAHIQELHVRPSGGEILRLPKFSPLPASWSAIHLAPSTGRQRHPDHCAYQCSQRREHLFAEVRQPDAGARPGIRDSARGQADTRSHRQPDECVSPAMPWPLQCDAPDVLPGEHLLAGRRVDRQ
jgi:hypothetical protein